MTEAIQQLLSGIVRLGAVGAAIALAALLAMGLAEILLRGLLDTSLPFAVEYSGYLVALVFFWGSGWALSESGHIRLDFVISRVSRRSARRLDIVATLLALLAAVALAAASIAWAFGTMERGTVSFFPSATPLAIPQFIFATGPALLALGALHRLLCLLHEESK